MARLRVLLTFSDAPDNALDETAGAVIQGMTGNAAFPTPPVTMAALQTARQEFADAVAGQEAGGKEATAVKNAKREALITLLRKLAAYVQENCNDVLETLLSSGFKAASTTHAQSPLAKPTIVGVTNGPDSGQLGVKVTPVPNAKSYELRYAILTAPGAPIPWQHGGTFTDSRHMLLEDLTPGTMYQIQARAIGGSTGHSGWSDSQQHMSM
ncbi:MAG: fibronectin type III domain-containing protein [Verrucomicrobia bacterium]|nr:fibronectin type III domain-containing protein [Verrucomicrobiota bacterium]